MLAMHLHPGRVDSYAAAATLKKSGEEVGMRQKGGGGWCSLRRGYSQGTSTTGSPNAILPVVNRIQRKCSYIYVHTRVRSFP